MTKEAMELVNLYKPLKDWCERNKGIINDINTAENKQFSESYMNVANSMLMCASRWLDAGKEESEFTRSTPEDKVASAVIGMAHIYNTNQHYLEPDKRKSLRISYRADAKERTML